jgi:hypothetical protein
METSVVVAVVLSAIGVVTAATTAVLVARHGARIRAAQREFGARHTRAEAELERLEDQLRRVAVVRQRQTADREDFDRYRNPLLVAAYDLGERIDMIHHRGFSERLRAGADRQRDTTLRSTAFRVARYFAVVELLGTALSQDTPGQGDVDLQAVAGLVERIGRTFATQALDPVEGSTRARWVFWREEQRAIGELMSVSEGGGPSHSVGYASFVREYDDRYAPWFADFVADLQTGPVADSRRLACLHRLLADLVVRLDERRTYTRLDDSGHPTSPEWITG